MEKETPGVLGCTTHTGLLQSALIHACSRRSFPQGDEIFWALGFVEGTRQLKGACDDRFPEYKEQNESAFLASPYSQMTGEELIARLEDGPQKSKLQQLLPTVRASQAQEYKSMNPTLLGKMCAGFPESMEKLKAGMAK